MKHRAIFLVFLTSIVLGQGFVSIVHDGFTASVDPRNGLYALGAEDSMALSAAFGNPYIPGEVTYQKGNAFSIKIGADVYRSHSFFPGDTLSEDLDPWFVTAAREGDSLLICEWNVETDTAEVSIKQSFRFNERGQMELQYSVHNWGIDPVDVGLKAFMGSDSLVDVAPGAFYADEGVIWDPDRPHPSLFQFLNSTATYTHHRLIIHIEDDDPEWVAVGDFLDIAVNPWEIREEDFGAIGDFAGVILRWDEGRILPYENQTFTVIFEDSLHEEPHIEPWDFDCTLLSDGVVGHSECNIDTIYRSQYLVTHTDLEAVDTLIICLELPAYALLEHSGASCDTLLDVRYLDIHSTEFDIKIPLGYGKTGPHSDMISLSIDADGHSFIGRTDTLITPCYDPGPYEADYTWGDEEVTFFIGDSVSSFEPSYSSVRYIVDGAEYDITGITMTDISITCPRTLPLITESGDTINSELPFDICLDLVNSLGCQREECFTLQPTLSLKEGWNLISLSYSLNLELYLPMIPPAYTLEGGVYTEMRYSEPGVGFWVLCPNDTTVVGRYVDKHKHGRWHLEPGWKMIGSPRGYMEIPSSPALPLDEVYWFDTETGTYSGDDMMIPQRGYMLLSNDSLEIAF